MEAFEAIAPIAIPSFFTEAQSASAASGSGAIVPDSSGRTVENIAGARTLAGGRPQPAPASDEPGAEDANIPTTVDCQIEPPAIAGGSDVPVATALASVPPREEPAPPDDPTSLPPPGVSSLRTLYIHEHGAVIRCEDEHLRIMKDEVEVLSLPAFKLDQIPLRQFASHHWSYEIVLAARHTDYRA